MIPLKRLINPASWSWASRILFGIAVVANIGRMAFVVRLLAKAREYPELEQRMHVLWALEGARWIGILGAPLLTSVLFAFSKRWKNEVASLLLFPVIWFLPAILVARVTHAFYFDTNPKQKAVSDLIQETCRNEAPEKCRQLINEWPAYRLYFVGPTGKNPYDEL